MWPICKKELRQAFSSLTGYIAIAVFLLVNGLVLFVLRNNILETGYATLDQFFSFAPWVLLFLSAAITMRSFADEFRGGTFEILGTRPLSMGQIIAGKFFGAFFVALVALLPTLVYYFTINHLASGEGIDSGAAIGSYLGLVLLTGVFIAIGICVSSFTTNSVVSFITTILISVLFYYGFSAVSELDVFKNGADYYVEMLGISFHYQSISKGVVDTRDVLYFITLILFFLLVTKTRLSKELLAKKGRSPLRWAFLLAGLFLINFVASKIHFRKDLTEEKRYSITATTKNLLGNLQNDVFVDVFLTGELPSGFRKLGNSTQEFLSVLKEANPGKIQYRFISPEEDAGNGRLWGDSLRSAGVEPINLSVQVKAGEENKNIFPYALVHSAGQTDVVNLFPSSKRNISVAELNNAEALMEYGFAKSFDKLGARQ
ncbi:MAG TPA: Gldg family protein, partial [Flavisolibacter sp.]|nr:Gldg family protein [Flavisolibacter sp.]